MFEHDLFHRQIGMPEGSDARNHQSTIEDLTAQPGWNEIHKKRGRHLEHSIHSDFKIALEHFTPAFDTIMGELKRDRKKMLITMHRYLDGDAFGSAIALGLILRKLHIDSTLLCVPFVPEKFDFLSLMSHLTILEANENIRLYSRSDYAKSLQDFFPGKISEYGALTILDCAGFGQIPLEAWSIGQTFPHKINIDHHVGHALDSDKAGILNLVGDCSSTCEVLFHLMQNLGIEPDPEIAVPLYVGINADLRKNDISEDNPAYPSAVIRELKVQVDKLGGDTHREIANIFSLDPWEKHLLNTIKDRIGFAGNIVYASFDREMVLAAKRETDSLDNPRMPFHEFHIQLRQLMRQFRDAYQVVVLFDQMLDKVSLFDLHKNHALDLAGISKGLGGGGHANRAGFTFEAAREKLLDNGFISADASENEVKNAIVEFIRRRLSEPSH